MLHMSFKHVHHGNIFTSYFIRYHNPSPLHFWHNNTRMAPQCTCECSNNHCVLRALVATSSPPGRPSLHQSICDTTKETTLTSHPWRCNSLCRAFPFDRRTCEFDWFLSNWRFWKIIYQHCVFFSKFKIAFCTKNWIVNEKNYNYFFTIGHAHRSNWPWWLLSGLQ